MRGILLAVAVAVAVAALAGCGGTTKTVSVSSAPAPSPAATSTSASRSTTTTSSAAPSRSTSTAATRTASAPAFTSQSAPAGAGTATAAAAAVVRAHGYAPNDTSQYHPNQTLGVLVGTRSPSGDGYGQQAFFFVDGRYIGTDSTQPSATLKVVSQSDTEVTLGYPLYRAHDALCCPSGGEARVRFALDNGRLTPLQAIPPASSRTGLSRQ